MKQVQTPEQLTLQTLVNGVIPDAAVATETQHVLKSLSDKGLRPVDIARRTGDRFSERTIYRWSKGECEPKQLEHVRVLRKLLKRVTEDPNFLLTYDVIT
jgi:hypothetical protein